MTFPRRLLSFGGPLRAALPALALLSLSCSYYNYLAPVPRIVHEGPPLPLHFSVQVSEGGNAEISVPRAVMTKYTRSIQDFVSGYFERTRTFEAVDTAFPGDVEILVEVRKFVERITDSKGLQSSENEVTVEIGLRYKIFCRFKPELSHEGEALGFGSVSSAEPLSIRMHQLVMGQALQTACDTMFKDLVPPLWENQKAAREWAKSQGRGVAAPAGAKKDSWEEVKPVKTKQGQP